MSWIVSTVTLLYGTHEPLSSLDTENFNIWCSQLAQKDIIANFDG